MKSIYVVVAAGAGLLLLDFAFPEEVVAILMLGLGLAVISWRRGAVPPIGRMMAWGLVALSIVDLVDAGALPVFRISM